MRERRSEGGIGQKARKEMKWGVGEERNSIQTNTEMREFKSQ